MKVSARKITAALGGLLTTAAIAGTMVTSAHAQDPTYFSIVQMEGNHAFALKAWESGAVTRPIFDDHTGGVTPTERWFKRNEANGIASYESVRYPGRCLEVPTTLSSAPLRTAPCQTFLARQKWTQGFSSDPFRKFENLESHKVATHKLASSGQPDVTQQVEGFVDGQLWQVKQTFRGPYVQ